MDYREYRESLYRELDRIQLLIDNRVVNKEEVLQSVLSVLQESLYNRLILLGLNDKDTKNTIKTVTLYQVTKTIPITIRPYCNNKPLFSNIQKFHKSFVNITLDYNINDVLFEHDIIDLMNNERATTVNIKVN